MDVARSPLERGEDDRVHQPDHRAHFTVLHHLLEGKPRLSVFLIVDDVQPELLRRLVEDPLRGVGLLEKVPHLARSGHFDHEAPVELRLELVQPGQVRGIGHGDHQKRVVGRLQGKKFVVHHVLQRYRAQELEVGVEITQIDELKLVALGESLRLFEFGIEGQCFWHVIGPWSFVLCLLRKPSAFSRQLSATIRTYFNAPEPPERTAADRKRPK